MGDGYLVMGGGCFCSLETVCKSDERWEHTGRELGGCEELSEGGAWRELGGGRRGELGGGSTRFASPSLHILCLDWIHFNQF